MGKVLNTYHWCASSACVTTRRKIARNPPFCFWHEQSVSCFFLTTGMYLLQLEPMRQIYANLGWKSDGQNYRRLIFKHRLRYRLCSMSDMRRHLRSGYGGCISNSAPSITEIATGAACFFAQILGLASIQRCLLSLS